MGPFFLIEPPRLETQQDGRRFALEILRALRDAGRKKCSAHPEDRHPRRQQFGALLSALVELENEGTSQARAGFASVLTDLLGNLLAGSSIPEVFQEREDKGLFMRWKGEIPKRPDYAPRLPQPRTGHKPKKKGIDWALLNPGRKMRETGDRGREAPEAPESTQAGKPGSPAPYPPRGAR